MVDLCPRVQKAGEILLTEEQNRMAYNGEPMPYMSDLFDMLEYQFSRLNYQQFRQKLITKELAKKEKEQFRRMLDELRQKYIFELKWIDKTAERYKILEKTSSAYGRSRTLENADELWKAVQGLL